jgi:hypothetical protein
MAFVGRHHELGVLRSALDRTDASLLSVTGARGSGKSALVRRAVDGAPTLLHRIPPLPEPEQRGMLARHVREGLASLGRPIEADADPTSSWHALLDALVDAADTEGPALVLVLDDAHRLTESRARVLGPLETVLERGRTEGRRLHVVLVGRPGEIPGTDEPTVSLAPLPFRSASTLLPGADAREKIRAYAVFGGLPRHLGALDPGATLVTNLRRTVLAPDGPLRDAGLDLLERDIQTPSRYVAILSTLAGGEADWGRVHEGVADLTRSGQVAPYLNRLEELGLIEIRRSLDAGPRSRNRRYRVADPFLAFWFRFVLSERARVESEGNDTLAHLVRRDLDAHVASVFPMLCRQYMALDAMETLGANAREHGSLWGPGYDIDVAGLLHSGPAFYGRALWSAEPADVDVLDTLDRQIGETRYGFGRESRLRIIFSGGGFTPALERAAARRHDAILLGTDALAEE